MSLRKMIRAVLSLWVMLTISVDVQASNFISYASSDINTATFPLSFSGKYSFENNASYVYQPSSPATGISMIKITGSNITLDLNDIGFSISSLTHAGWIGIEIGWTPQELIADPSRVQPKNICVQNGSLSGFDCGMVVHAGVQRVQIEDVNFFDCSVGVVMMGTSNDPIQDIDCSNLIIVGSEQNTYTALVSLKTLFEMTFGYGSNYFMPLAQDPFNGNSVDVYSYYGIWMKSVIKASFQDIRIQDMGYDYVDNGSAGNGFRTQGISFLVKNSRHISMDKVLATEAYGEIKSVGLLLDNTSSINIKNSRFGYNLSAKRSVGIEVTNDTAADYSVTAITLDHVNTRNNRSDEVAIGMDLSSVRGLGGYHLQSKFNIGGLLAYGVYMNKGYTIDFQDSTFSENTATRQINDVATDQGIAAFGFYGTNINSMQMKLVDLCSMQALNTASGCYVVNSTSLRFDTCQFVANIATSMRSGEAAAIRSQQDAQEISKHAPVVSATSSGGYGAYLKSTNYVKIQDCLANSNSGHRAIGLTFNACRAIAIYDTFASTQYATGQMLDSTFATDNAANPYGIAIKPIHRPLLFGDLTKTSVDAVTTTDIFLSKIASIRAAQVAGSDPAYADVVSMMATSTLMQSLIARYRLWSVAMGIHAYNVSGFLLNNCTCVGNVSLFDTGVGVCFTGRNTDHTLRNSQLAFNIGGYVSLITASTNPANAYAYSYNLVGMKNFWETLLQGTPWASINTINVGFSVLSMAISPDGTKFAVGTSNNDIKIYKVSDWSLLTTLTGHTANVTALAWSPDGTQLASGAANNSSNIKIWNTTSWTVIQTLTHGVSGINALAYRSDGAQLASGGAAILNNLVVWNTSTWTAATTQTIGLVGVKALAWKPDSTQLAIGSLDASSNVKVLSSAAWSLVQTLNFHTQQITALAWSADGAYLVSGSSDDLIKVYTTSGWSLATTLTASAGDVLGLAFRSDGKYLASAHATNTVNVWSTSSWGTVAQTYANHTGAVNCVTWGINGRRLMSGGADGTLRSYWSDIYKKASATTALGIYNTGPTFTLQGQKEYGNFAAGDDVFVRLKSADRALVSPIGPMGAGLIMGDMLLEGVVQDCKLYGNMGNSGHTYGAVLDHVYSVTFDNNLIAGNIANVYGMSVGMMDITAHSPNLFMRNTFEGNKCSIFNNGNYFVPFNPSDTNTLAFPVKKMMNGKFANTTTDYDNIEIQYSQSPEFYDIEYLQSIPQHPDLTAYLTSQLCWS